MDGIVFTKVEEVYQSNYLWQTPQMSQVEYNGQFTTVLEVDDDIHFRTLDGEIFGVSTSQDFSYQLCLLEPG